MIDVIATKPVELLAPAGTFEILEQLLGSGADAVYLGGKRFNMRMHRPDFNLSDDELMRAISLGRQAGVKVYVTFNNMMSEDELADAREFLLFLQEARPDALIIQDMGALALIRSLGIDLPLHASVMMNVHNRAMIHRLSELGVSRIVASREMSLAQVELLAASTQMEFEYFVHGDMCAVHGAQCLYSGYLFDKSSNRGLCMKPCRWPYKLRRGERDSETWQYHLAVKDMCMYRHIPELIQAGVTSFKVEGRMREVEYLLALIRVYREAIDRYLTDPAAYYVNGDANTLRELRVRGLSTAYAFKIPGRANLELTGENEPRVFSHPAEEKEICAARVATVRRALARTATREGATGLPEAASRPLLSVKVNDIQGATAAAGAGADIVYLSGDPFRPGRPATRTQIKRLTDQAGKTLVYLALPHMMFERQFADYSGLIGGWRELGVAGLLVTNLGAAAAFRPSGIPMAGDYFLNVYNAQAASFYGDEGLSRVTASVEAGVGPLGRLLRSSTLPIEVVGQGSPVVMYMRHCVYAAELSGATPQDWCEGACEEGHLELVDKRGGVHPVFADQYCENHVISAKDICLAPLLGELAAAGLAGFRVEGQHYPPGILAQVVALYRALIDAGGGDKTGNESAVARLRELTGRGQTLGALNFD